MTASKSKENKFNQLCDYDFSQYSQILAVYLFGSRAKGSNKPDADIDISLIMDADFDLLKNYDLPLTVASDLENFAKCKVDVVLFHKMDPIFQTEIRTKGKLIFTRDLEKLKKVLFKARKVYEDYLKLHRYYIRALKKRYVVSG